MNFIRDRRTERLFDEAGYRVFIGTPLPAVLTPEVLNFNGADPVVTVPLPEFNPIFQKVRQNGAEQANGGWQVKWLVESLFNTPLEEQQAVAKQEVEQKAHLRRNVSMTARSVLDGFARERGYFDVVSAVSYLSSTNTQYKAEAERVNLLRDQFWAKYNEVYAEVDAKTRAEPQNYSDIVGDMIILTWE